MTEAKLQKLCMLECGKRGALCYHFESTHLRLPDGIYRDSGVPVGWPDLIVIKPNGDVHFVELKVGDNKPTKEQRKFLEILPNSHLVYSLDLFIQEVF